MQIQVLFDSKYGNTERVARAIARALGEDVRVDAIEDNARVEPGISLLLVGGPTQGHGTSPTMKAFLDRLPLLEGMPVAAFDTRLTWPKLLSGAASDRIGKALTQRGARLVVPPESFLVSGAEGPLVEGELERAEEWAKGVAQGMRVPA